MRTIKNVPMPFTVNTSVYCIHWSEMVWYTLAAIEREVKELCAKIVFYFVIFV